MTRSLSRARRSAAVVLGTAALVAGPLAVSPADAAERPRAEKPAKADKADKGRAKQLLKTVAGKDKRLARMSTSNAVTRLDDAYESEVVAGIEDSREALAAIAIAVEAADAAVDTSTIAKDLRAFRVENHRLVVNVVAKADRIHDAATAAGDTATAALATTAIEAALAVTATSPKSEIKAARAALDALEDETEDETGTGALPAS